MGRVSIREMRRAGVSNEDIQCAREFQEAQRRAGASVQPLTVILGLESPQRRQQQASPSTASVTDIMTRALRRRGTYDQAAFLIDQQALTETPERADLAREASRIVKKLSASKQLEFDFFGGNVSIAFQYQDAVTERLFTVAPTTTKAKEALSILWTICRHLSWQSYECTKTASNLCDLTRTDKAHMARALELLEQVGAIRRVKRGRTKVITVTPEGAFRGNVNNHGQAVERYKLEVIEGGKKDQEITTETIEMVN